MSAAITHTTLNSVAARPTVKAVGPPSAAGQRAASADPAAGAASSRSLIQKEGRYPQ